MLLRNGNYYLQDSEITDKSIANAKQLFGENLPYVIEHRFGEKIHIFNGHFIQTLREALTTGCMAKMNNAEVTLTRKFVEYQNQSFYRDITTRDNEVVVALDKWLMDDVMCNEHPKINECFDASAHSWLNCEG